MPNDSGPTLIRSSCQNQTIQPNHNDHDIIESPCLFKVKACTKMTMAHTSVTAQLVTAMVQVTLLRQF